MGMGAGLERMGIGAILDFESDAAVASMGKASKALDGMKAGLGRVGAGVTQAAGGVATVAASFVPAVLGAGAAVAGGVQRFAAYETSLAKIGSLLDGGSKEAAVYGSEIERMSMKFGQSAGQIADGTFEAISAGVAANEATGFMEQATKGAIAGFTDTKAVVDALTTTMNAYGDQLGANATAAEKAAKINDIMFYANKFGKTTVDEMGRSLGNVVSTASLAKVPIEEIGAAIAAMTMAGVKTPQAVTSLNQALLAFVSPAEGAAKTAKQYGIDLSITGLRAKGLQGALADVSKKLAGNDTALAKIFGSVDAFKAAAVLAGEGAGNFSNALEVMRTQGGITERVFDDVSKTLDFGFGRTVQVLDNAARGIGRAFVEEFGMKSGTAADLLADKLGGLETIARRVFQAVRGSVERLRLKERFEQASQAVQRFSDILSGGIGSARTQQLTDIAVAGTAILVALAPLALVVAPVVAAFAGMASAAMGLVTALGGVQAMASGASAAAGALGAAALPAAAAAVVVGAAALGVANNTYGAGDAASGVVGVFGLLTDSLLAAAGTLITSLQPAFFGLVGALSGVFNYLETVWEMFAVVLIPAFRLGMSVVSVLASVLGTVLGPPLALVGRAFGALGSALREYVLPVFSAIGDAITWLSEKLEAFVGTLTDAVNKAYDLLGVSTSLPGMSDKAKSDRATGRMVDDAFTTTGNTLRKGYNAIPSIPQLGDMAASAKAAVGDKLDQLVAGMSAPQPVTINNKLSVDGKGLHVASSTARLELMQRAGANVTPWQRRQIIERGSVTMNPSPG